MTPDLQNEFDCLVIGAGPAGSSAAAILAERGRRVLVLEREQFPRYHIGESLIPFTYHPLERLGLIPQLRASAFVKKHSVQFVSPSGKASQPFYFSTRYDANVSQTWQILRSEFDVLLLNRARELGATVLEETAVTGFLEEKGQVIGVTVRMANGSSREFRAPITLDCSGKEAFAALRYHWRQRDPFLNKVAVWTYYEGAKRDPGIDAGATTVAFVPEKGWFWYIPQHQDRVSVGVVAEGKYLSREGVKDPGAIFQREVGQNLWVREHLSQGRQTGPYFITSEYTFHSRYCGRDGLLLVGDAYCFLDPVFSSGLMLALKSGVMAGDAVHEALTSRDFRAARFQPYATELREGIENMRKLVYAFYNPGFAFRDLTNKYPDMVGPLTDCLSGDVNKDFSLLWERIGEFSLLPEVMPLGQPMTSAVGS